MRRREQKKGRIEVLPLYLRLAKTARENLLGFWHTAAGGLPIAAGVPIATGSPGATSTPGAVGTAMAAGVAG